MISENAYHDILYFVSSNIWTSRLWCTMNNGCILLLIQDFELQSKLQYLIRNLIANESAMNLLLERSNGKKLKIIICSFMRNIYWYLLFDFFSKICFSDFSGFFFFMLRKLSRISLYKLLSLKVTKWFVFTKSFTQICFFFFFKTGFSTSSKYFPPRDFKINFLKSVE